MLIYPPGEIYQRGEDRCQINVNASVSNALRACNDIGYIAALLKQIGFSVFLRDYPAEKLSLDILIKDINEEKPDVVFISTTNGSIYYDIEIINTIKKLKSDIVIILKGALFFKADEKFLSDLNLSDIDYLIASEAEFIAPLLIESHFYAKSDIKNIQGISYKENGKWITNNLVNFVEDIDSLPFPERSLMKNELYINPDTNKPMATITTSKGCPFSCIYCLSPELSGKKVRFRSVDSVLKEIEECYKKHNITDFFFKSDTFTVNKKWVEDLCNALIESDLNGKINWVANSRVNTIDEDIIIKMKSAGCSMIALGIESGSDESLQKMQKGITVEESINAVKLIKKHHLKIFGFYMIGFPWETQKHLELTRRLIFKLDTDFIEISVVTPFRGTKLYDSVKDNLKNSILGKDAFKYSVSIDNYLSESDLAAFRRDVILKYHFRLSYILKKLFNKKLTAAVLLNYIRYAIRLVKNSF